MAEWRHTLKLLLNYILSRYKRDLFIRSLLSIIIGLSSAALVYSNKLLFDHIGRPIVAKKLFYDVSIFCVIQVSAILIQSVNNRVNDLGASKIKSDLEQVLYQKQLSLSLETLETPDTHTSIMLARNYGIDAVFSTINNLLSLLNSLIGITSILYISISITTSMLSVILIIPILSLYLNTVVDRKLDKNRETTAKLKREQSYINSLALSPQNSREIKSYLAEAFFINKLRAVLSNIFENEREQFLTQEKMRITLALLEFIAELYIIMVAVVQSVSDDMPFGTITMFIAATQSIRAHINSIFVNLRDINQNRLFSRYFFDLLQLNSEQETGSLCPHIHSITIDNLSFTYPGTTKKVIKNVNLELFSGDRILLIGPNGVGKSTLVKLLAGLYHTYEGSIKINGIDLRDISIESYRKKVSVFFQDYTNFDLSIEENTYFDSRISEAQMNKMRNLHAELDLQRKIKEKNIKHGTRLGYWDGSIVFSGGEAQRIAIARCLAKQADFYIFDEITSAQDSISRRNLFRSVLVPADDIRIMITHNQELASKYATKVFRIKNGEIFPDSTP